MVCFWREVVQWESKGRPQGCKGNVGREGHRAGIKAMTGAKCRHQNGPLTWVEVLEEKVRAANGSEGSSMVMPRGHHLRAKHTTIYTMYHEWFGLQVFGDAKRPPSEGKAYNNLHYVS